MLLLATKGHGSSILVHAKTGEYIVTITRIFPDVVTANSHMPSAEEIDWDMPDEASLSLRGRIMETINEHVNLGMV